MGDTLISEVDKAKWMCHLDTLLRVITLMYLGRPGDVLSAVQSNLISAPTFDSIWLHVKKAIAVKDKATSRLLEAAVTILQAYLIPTNRLAGPPNGDRLLDDLRRRRARDLLQANMYVVVADFQLI